MVRKCTIVVLGHVFLEKFVVVAHHYSPPPPSKVVSLLTKSSSTTCGLLLHPAMIDLIMRSGFLAVLAVFSHYWSRQVRHSI